MRAEETGYIETSGLEHRYSVEGAEPVLALAGVDLRINQGEFVAIIGPNGSGKSTLAKHFNVLLLPSKGRVRVFGMDTQDTRYTWEIRRSAGMVFQNPDNQIVATIVEEDVAFGPENLGVPPREIRERVEESLAAVGMLEFRKRAPHLLSGGQKQRVAIAGILAMRPKCIVLDEPTAMLDPRGREEVLSASRRLNEEQGITIVLITHFMDEALAADRVVVMDKGKIVAQGSPREVFSKRDVLEQLGLDIPPIGKLAQMLRDAGLNIRQDTFDVDELVEQLCLLKSGT